MPRLTLSNAASALASPRVARYMEAERRIARFLRIAEKATGFRAYPALGKRPTPIWIR